jgi:GT2 family glycosyltransferase
MTSNPLVSCVIVNYNGKGILDQCISSILTSSYEPIEIIVVDNNSTDGSYAEICTKYKNFKNILLLKNKINAGLGAAYNLGVKKAHGQYVMLLNNDVIITHETIANLVKEASKSKDAGLYQPAIFMLDKPSIINSTGLLIHIAGFGILRGVGEKDVEQYDKEREITGVHGACVFALKEALQDIGLFDEILFAFNEDTDLGWRALLAGWKPKYIPYAKVYHKWGHSWGSSISLEKLYYEERNRLILILSNYERRTLILLLPIIIITEASTLFWSLKQGLIRAKIRAYADLIKLRNHISNRYRQIQLKRRVRDKEVIKNFTLDIRHIYIGRSVEVLNKILKFIYYNIIL